MKSGKLARDVLILVAIDAVLLFVNWPLAIIAMVIWLVIAIIRFPAWFARTKQSNLDSHVS